MVALKNDIDLDEIAIRSAHPVDPRRARFRVSGEEMIEKKVKSSGNSGRIYLPLDWVGKHVKIIRID